MNYNISDLLKGRERMLLALFAGILFMVVQALFPELKFTQEQSLSFLVILSSYIFAEGMSAKEMQFKIVELFKSHKFQLLLAGVVVVFINAFFPDVKITEDKLIEIIGLFSTFIVSAGLQK